jgi:hypothetical protein
MSNNKLSGGKLDPGVKSTFGGQSLQLLFRPDFQSTDPIDLETVKGLVDLEVAFIPNDNSGKKLGTPINGASATVAGNELVFSIANAELDRLADGKDGLFIFSVNGTSVISKIRRTNAQPKADQQLADAVTTIAEKENLPVQVLKSVAPPSPLQRLFKGIVDSTNQISFNEYKQYVDQLFCQGFDQTNADGLNKRRSLPFNDSESYRVLKVASEAFLMLKSGVFCNFDGFGEGTDDNPAANDDQISIDRLWQNYLKTDKDEYQKTVRVLPFLFLIRQKFGDIGITTNWIDNLIDLEMHKCQADQVTLKDKCFGIVRQRLQYPLFLELIFSYWQEEGMLVQTMNAISLRFQNMKSGYRDPLAEMEISHLRPLNNILWGYIQDQQHLLSVKRRAYEYDHHYGITLQGKAVSALNSADSRVRFIGAFHNLLNLVTKYYAESANKLVEPDPFPILNALRDVHFIIAEGMHNQYGDLPTTARMEMLMQQWILAQPEFREFLPGRSAIPFTEPWMDRVAAMNRLQGWTDTSPMHFDNLAKFGEQILLSIRFANWSDQSRRSDEAALWANYFRSQIQGYIHSYKAATGVDLSVVQVGTEVDSQAPAVHLIKRSKVAQHGNAPKPSQGGIPIKKPISKESF